MNRPLTVSELYNELSIQMRKGNENRYIYISDDDEGNGYHGLYFPFSEVEDIMFGAEIDWFKQRNDLKSTKDAIILG